MISERPEVKKRDGVIFISDIVADEPVPDHLKNDPELWSGCVSGALEQNEFLRAFEQAGFYGIEILKRDSAPWRTVEGIEFRSITVRHSKASRVLASIATRQSSIADRGARSKTTTGIRSHGASR
jgi:hypothetical protein